MNVLLVGSGAREHALAWKLAQSPTLTALHAAPGNPGIGRIGTCHPVPVEDQQGLLDLARRLEIDLVVVGPEGPLVSGLADILRAAGFSVFGPSASAARIEGSKTFAKEVMSAAGVPVPALLDEPKAPCVVKADGLASGKGVFICRTEAEMAEGIEAAAGYGGPVVIEELLEGPEVSLFALCDGTRAIPIGSAQDFKRAFDADLGPNTGGMGAYSPVPWLDDADALVAQIHQPVIDELARRGTPFIGCLFAGLMITPGGPRVLEFNARFGDPETQVVLARLDGDLLHALVAAATGDLTGVQLSAKQEAAVNVVLAGPEYPARSDYSGAEITGIEEAEAAGVLVFHGGTALQDGRLVTQGGRILSVTARAPTIEAARIKAYEGAEIVEFEGMRYRTDIAAGIDG